MVLQVVKYDVHPDKVEAYLAWAKTAIPRVVNVPGLVEFRAYRPVTGASQVVTLYEFADMAALSSWYYNEETQKLISERRIFTLNEISEIWGSSPLVPEPIRPGA